MKQHVAYMTAAPETYGVIESHGQDPRKSNHSRVEPHKQNQTSDSCELTEEQKELW